MSPEEIALIEAATRFANYVLKAQPAKPPTEPATPPVFNIQIIQPPPQKLAYTIKGAAEQLGISERSVDRLIERKLIKPSLALRTKMIPRTELERFLRDTI